MLQNLQNELNNLQIKYKQQDINLKNLYINFQEIYHLQNKMYNPTTIKHNMLKRVRPEVFHQILIFFDIKYILRFRLVSRRANEVVKFMLPKLIIIFQQIIVDQQNEIQLKIQSIQEEIKDQNQEQILKTALDGVETINKNHIVEVRSYARPPELVHKIMNLICLTLDPAFKIEKDNWKECKKYLCHQNFLDQILHLDICSLNDKQIQQLEQVNNIQEEQASAISTLAGSIVIFLKVVLVLRQSKLYMTQNMIKQLENKIKKQEQLIQKLKKIIIQE